MIQINYTYNKGNIKVTWSSCHKFILNVILNNKYKVFTLFLTCTGFIEKYKLISCYPLRTFTIILIHSMTYVINLTFESMQK